MFFISWLMWDVSILVAGLLKAGVCEAIVSVR